MLQFEDANVVKSADGYDIQLTKDQARALAESLYENE